MIARKWPWILVAMALAIWSQILPVASQGEIWESSHAGVYDGFAPALVELASDLLQTLIHEAATKKSRSRDASESPDAVIGDVPQVAPLTIPSLTRVRPSDVNQATVDDLKAHDDPEAHDDLDLVGVAEEASTSTPTVTVPLELIAVVHIEKINEPNAPTAPSPSTEAEAEAEAEAEGASDTNTSTGFAGAGVGVASGSGLRGIQEDGEMIDNFDENSTSEKSEENLGVKAGKLLWSFFHRLLFWL